MAVESEFRCPKCKNKMNAVDNKKQLEEYQKQLGATETLLMKMGETPE